MMSVMDRRDMDQTDGRLGPYTGRDLNEQHAEEAALIGRLTGHEPFTTVTLEALDPSTLPATLGVRLIDGSKRRNIIGSWMAHRVKTGHVRHLGNINGRQRLWQVPSSSDTNDLAST